MGMNKIRDVLLSGYSNLSVVMATAWDRMSVPLLERQKQNSFIQRRCVLRILLSRSTLNVHDLSVI